MSVAGSFTVELHEHLSADRILYIVKHLQAAGARVEEQSPRRFVAHCENESDVASVGRSLFNSHLKELLTVVAVSGVARAAASAYPFPKTRAERKGR
jgi:hypothetical protein